MWLTYIDGRFRRRLHSMLTATVIQTLTMPRCQTQDGSIGVFCERAFKEHTIIGFIQGHVCWWSMYSGTSEPLSGKMNTVLRIDIIENQHFYFYDGQCHLVLVKTPPPTEADEDSILYMGMQCIGFVGDKDSGMESIDDVTCEYLEDRSVRATKDLHKGEELLYGWDKQVPVPDQPVSRDQLLPPTPTFAGK